MRSPGETFLLSRMGGQNLLCNGHGCCLFHISHPRKFLFFEFHFIEGIDVGFCAGHDHIRIHALTDDRISLSPRGERSLSLSLCAARDGIDGKLKEF